MLVFKFCGAKICLDFSFFAVLALFFFFDNGMGLCAFLCCICHELGHLTVMIAGSVDVNSVMFYGGGIRISSSLNHHGWKTQLAVDMAGCTVNLLFALALYLLGAYQASAVSLMIGAVNLMPFGKLDGARIAELMCVKLLSADVVGKAMCYVKIFYAIAAATILLLIGGEPDVTVIVFFIYMMFIDRLQK